MKESVVERHLHTQVVKAGGTTYKFVSPGRKNVPDRIVIWPKKLIKPGDMSDLLGEWRAAVEFVECKAPGKKANPAQAREHVRLMKLNCVVLVLDTKAKVDAYLGRNR